MAGPANRDRDADYVVMNPKGVRESLNSAQTNAAILAVAEGLAEATTAMSHREFRAFKSEKGASARAAVVPWTMHSINSENLHHWLNRVLP